MPRVTAIHIAACLFALSHIPAVSAHDSSTALNNAAAQDRAHEASAVRRQGGPSTSRTCLPMKLRSLLSTIESQYGPVQVISTHRPGARIAGTHHASLHASCRAVDFHPAKGRYREVLAYLQNNWDGGIGTYSGTLHHLHVDVGSKKVWHTHAGGTRVAAGDRPGAARRTTARRQSTTVGFQPREMSIY